MAFVTLNMFFFSVVHGRAKVGYLGHKEKKSEEKI